MKMKKSVFLILCFSLSASFTGLVAKAELGQMEAAQGSAAVPPPRGFPLVNGVVRRIDLSDAKIMIKHDAIPNLGMPAMTMTFSAVDSTFLKVVKPGDKIRFAADDVGGELTLLWLEKSVGGNQ